MEISLVCIAKNEDNYIDEWIDYHLKLGFDYIFIYQNDWRYISEKENPRVIKLTCDGNSNNFSLQHTVYNHFVQNSIGYTDWAMFMDVDEFLVLKKHNSIKEFIEQYKDLNAIGINWFLYGDNNLQDYDESRGVLKRFTKRQKQVNHHIKSIIKLLPNTVMGTHDIQNEHWYDTNRNKHIGPFNPDGPTDVACINHYFCKTFPEFKNKVARGRADCNQFWKLSEFEDHNFNEVEDLDAYNYMYVDNK